MKSPLGLMGALITVGFVGYFIISMIDQVVSQVGETWSSTHTTIVLIFFLAGILFVIMSLTNAKGGGMGGGGNGHQNPKLIDGEASYLPDHGQQNQMTIYQPQSQAHNDSYFAD